MVFGWRNVLTAFLVLFAVVAEIVGHEAKDFDDSILYRIDFEVPDFNENPELKDHLRTFHTHEKETYDCLIPVLENSQKEQLNDNPALSPYTLLRPLFTSSSCSYRIEAYWSYEICHGQHVRQYHEEREGKNVKFQEYLLGKWSWAQREQVIEQTWEENYKPHMKHKTTKIDNTKYPYFELEMTDGTMCDIINAPRTTIVRYVCYPHGKNEIYSFKETSSCNYEAIILTSVLCMIPGFHPEESKEVSIKCFNSPVKPHKPISMLRQELDELQLNHDDVHGSKEASAAMSALIRSSEMNRWLFLDSLHKSIEMEIHEKVLEIKPPQPDSLNSKEMLPSAILSSMKDFVSGRNCLTGGTGWWKYEFCYGRHVRQFHKDKKSEIELFLGYFDEDAHRQWISSNPDKFIKRYDPGTPLWHHYEKGTRCDRTGLPREVDVKLICTPVKNSPTAVSMYLLEPKTCQYILVIETPLMCGLMMLTDEYGLVDQNRLQHMSQKIITLTRPMESNPSLSTPPDSSTEEEESAVDDESPKNGVLGPTGDRGNTAVNEIEANEDVPT